MVDDWDTPRPKDNYGTRGFYDWLKSRKATDRETDIRTDKDQEMAKQVCGECGYALDVHPHVKCTKTYSKDKPWILKKASNWVSGLRNADKVGINPKDALGAAKVPMHLVPPSSMILQAYCMDDGAIKYGPYNVRMEDIQAIGYVAAAMRHLQAYMDGQDFDSVTGKPHLGYALATIGLVVDAWLNGTLIDNRPVPGIGGQLLDELAMKPGEEPRHPTEVMAIFHDIAKRGAIQTEERRGKGTHNTL